MHHYNQHYYFQLLRWWHLTLLLFLYFLSIIYSLYLYINTHRPWLSIINRNLHHSNQHYYFQLLRWWHLTLLLFLYYLSIIYSLYLYINTHRPWLSIINRNVHHSRNILINITIFNDDDTSRYYCFCIVYQLCIHYTCILIHIVLDCPSSMEMCNILM